ncbi:MAG: o-succinylbenzoate--CoA ligase [Frankiales bacterium]|nr:o-succinylbenzoate--CoA ligase [Frankiales bacterium]
MCDTEAARHARADTSLMTPFADRLLALADAAPDAPAITDSGGTLSRRELDQLSNQWARALQARGVQAQDIVSICLPSDRRFLVAAWAVWKLGATPQPLSSRIAPHELREIVELTRPAIVIGDAPGATTWDLTGAEGESTDPLPTRVAQSWKAPTSGGSTGRPKVILSTSAAVAEPLMALGRLLRIADEDVLLTPAPLHHNGPFLSASLAMLLGGHVVVMDRFDPQRALDLITDHRVGWLYSVPTIMSRMAKHPAAPAADLSSVHTMFHMAAPCAEWLKRWWIDKIGAEAVWELYAGTEVQAITTISGTEWLERPGSVGRPISGEITVLGEDGTPVQPGELGEVFMRSAAPTYRYLGGTARVVDGWESLGDMGWTDADGYLFLSDRKNDMVLVGGVNVYPAEVESALDAHPAVATSCVIGLPDEDLGNVLHAIVQLSEQVDDEELSAFLAERLAPHKRPRTFERSDSPLRDEAGKTRRSALREARLNGVPA